MELLRFILTAFLQFILLPLVTALPRPLDTRDDEVFAPKVMIISMWSPEAAVWHERLPDSNLGNLSSITVHAPGLSMLFPCATCTEDGSICHVTIGEGEINSAASVMALMLSPKFDFRHTYFLIAGIAGVNPKYGTLGSVAIARYSVQVALQYEIDIRSLPPGWPTGYISYGRDQPHQQPFITYGTEVFELNAQLQDAAYGLASKAQLEDANGPKEYRALYRRMGETYKSASQPPSVIKCDTATSDVYYSGSNFDRPPPDYTDLDHLTAAKQNGFSIAIANIFNAGIEIVKGVIEDWDTTFKDGIRAENYIGDIFGSLGGEPDFGFGSLTHGERIAPDSKSSELANREMDRRRILTQKSMRKI
ncbi:Purine nucleoside permease [Fusarium oxysporum f. sp. rapae]|uniref:Purine nucleoside permease n=1 Tax=Fusarium oxysporum f. sp. rapae TaxID=485398 RepID=A0A8J5P8A0_FUSOX|nr:Purine nucleoside permease [Fusarium oxysporum f. sp. rapae]